MSVNHRDQASQDPPQFADTIAYTSLCHEGGDPFPSKPFQSNSSKMMKEKRYGCILSRTK